MLRFGAVGGDLVEVKVANWARELAFLHGSSVDIIDVVHEMSLDMR
jgi:hypothetical protein